MAVPKIAVNGFGRIGRMVTRIAKERGHFDVVAINDLAPPEYLVHAFKYDSVHGLYPGEIRLDGDTMTIDNDPFTILSKSSVRGTQRSFPGTSWEWTMLLRARAYSASSISSRATWRLEPRG